MSALKDLLAQREALELEINEIRQVERSKAIGTALQLIREYALTQQDLFSDGRNASKTKTTNKVAAKYRDPATGKEWSGRGISPKWLEGKDRAQFLIAQ